MRPVRCLLHTMALLAAGLAAPAATAGEPSAADFARKPQYLDAQISPQGTYLALTYPVDDVIAVGIVDLKHLKPASTLRFSHQQHVQRVWWVSDRRIVVEMAKSLGPLDQPRLSGELYGMDADGSHKMYLFGYQGRKAIGTHITTDTAQEAWAYMVNPMPDDPDHALIAEVPWRRSDSYFIDRLDVNTGQRQRVSVLNAGYYFDAQRLGVAVAADGLGHPRYALGVSGQNRIVELEHDEAQQQWRRAQAGEIGRASLLGISRDGKTVWLASDEKGDKVCVQARHLDSGSSELLSCHERVDVDRLAMSDAEGRPLVALYEDSRPSAVDLGADEPAARIYHALQKSFAGQRVRITSQSADGQRMVVAVDSDRNPGDFYLFDRDTKKAEYLFSRRQWIDPAAMSPVEPISFRGRDGLPYYGYLTAPHGMAAEKRPLVMLPHGGPHGVRDTWSWDPWAQYLAGLGYVVLQVNYRGSDGYGAAFVAAGYRHWGSTMQDDLTDAAAWAVAQGIADPQRLCIMGASYGGYAALMSAVREPKLYRCAISMAGVYDLVTQVKTSDTADFESGRNYLARALGTDEAELRRQSPLAGIDKLQIPVLIAHGTADERVPFAQAKELRAALDRLKKPYVWLPFEGEEHGFNLEANHEKFLLATRRFLEENIGPGTPGAASVATP